MFLQKRVYYFVRSELSLVNYFMFVFYGLKATSCEDHQSVPPEADGKLLGIRCYLFLDVYN